MKKLHLKLVASVLTMTTLLTSAPINGFGEVSAKSISSKNSGISPGAKVAIGVGVVGAVAAAVLGATYFLTRDSDGVSSDNSKNTNKNGNLTNTQNLCYWHAFVQQMYSLKSFRKFINDVDLKGMKSETANKIKAFRELFSEMDKGERIDKNSSLAFANRILCGNVSTEVRTTGADEYVTGYEIKDLPIVGHQRDINEIWMGFISDVESEYKKHIKTDNVRSEPICIYGRPQLNLRSLLIGEPSYENKRSAVKNLAKNSEVREAYKKEFEKDFPEQVNDDVLNEIATLSDVPCVSEALKKLKSPDLDIPVIDDQFVIFVSRIRVDAGDCKKYTARVDFGDGAVNYKGKMFEVTAVSVHSGSGSGGHYYTYKKHGNSWYKYDDCEADVPRISWGEVKKDAETNCTMLTFTKK